MSVEAAELGVADGRTAEGRPPIAPSQPEPLVVRGVSKRFGASVALEEVDVIVGPGSIVGLVGANGSGKTTLLRLAAGLIRIDSGSIVVAGAPAGSPPARGAAARFADQHAGVVELTRGAVVGVAHG
ncbi:MAG: ATP-binding cassette domain-containing protein, partial [Thermoleophilia bacterium]|nr:ATP-binding cassette domain-containing protein [Thermoleophilia bacterium]